MLRIVFGTDDGVGSGGATDWGGFLLKADTVAFRAFRARMEACERALDFALPLDSLWKLKSRERD